MMKQIKMPSLIVTLSLLLIACEANMPSKQTTGAVLGGVAGGVAGSQVGEGRTRDVAMVVGTLLGAAVGGAIGNSMDTTDAVRTEQALSTNRKLSWTNPNTQAEYTVTPTRDYTDATGLECREFTTVAVINGKEEKLDGKACKQPDGTWKASD
jgi:surface antigen